MTTETRLSLAQQIALLEEPAPVDFDPEHIETDGGAERDDAPDVNISAAREHYLAVGPSALRKIHDSISDPKYDGVRTTRRQLNDTDSDGDSPCNSDYTNEEQHAHEVQNDQEQHEAEPQPPTPPSLNRLDQVTEPTDALPSTIHKTREEDRKKGKAISRQIAVWDALLDARIRLQKSVTTSNTLPALSVSSQITDHSECRDAVNKMIEQALLLSDELFALQEDLLVTNHSIQPPPRKKLKTRSESDEMPCHESEMEEATQSVSALENTFHPYLLQTLTKWSTKIQAVSPSALLPSNRNTFSSKSSQHLKPVTQLIDEALADQTALLTRTQLQRGKLGNEDAPKGKDRPLDPEIFDDTDFYQQLLRDVIDSRGDGMGQSDWMVTQKQKKAKKKVDTKASKGRKLRYEVHEKVQNFMVPVPMPGMWHEEQIDELFASLLGKGFENEVDLQNPDLSEQHVVNEALKGGYRVFG